MRKLERAEIRPLASGDLAAFQAYRTDPEVARYQSWSAMNDEEAAGFLTAVADVTALIPGEWIQLGIARDGMLIGDLGLNLSADERDVELGFTLAAGAQGKGLGGEVVKGALALIFETTPAVRVVGITDARNGPSILLMERVGYTKILEEETVFQGEPCTEITYEMTREMAADLGIIG